MDSLRPPIISARNITRVYRYSLGELVALQDASLEISRGDFVAIMGASGSGKSTLLNVLGCLDKPNKGEYFIDGYNVMSLDDDELSAVRSSHIGFVFQDFCLLQRLSVLQNVILPLKHSRCPLKKREITAARALLSVGLDASYFDRKTTELSGGQVQRVAIARAIVNNPSILLADEPTGNLDSKSSEVVMDVLLKLNEMGTTIVLITHDSNVAAKAKRTLFIRDGILSEDYEAI